MGYGVRGTRGSNERAVDVAAGAHVRRHLPPTGYQSARLIGGGEICTLAVTWLFAGTVIGSVSGFQNGSNTH